MARRRSDGDARIATTHDATFTNPYAAVHATETTSPWPVRVLTGAVLVTGAALGTAGTAAADSDRSGPDSFDIGDLSFSGDITDLDLPSFGGSGTTADFDGASSKDVEVSFDDEMAFPDDDRADAADSTPTFDLPDVEPPPAPAPTPPPTPEPPLDTPAVTGSPASEDPSGPEPIDEPPAAETAPDAVDPTPELGADQPAGTGDPATTPGTQAPSEPTTTPVDPSDTDAEPVTGIPLPTTRPTDAAENPETGLDEVPGPTVPITPAPADIAAVTDTVPSTADALELAPSVDPGPATTDGGQLDDPSPENPGPDALPSDAGFGGNPLDLDPDRTEQELTGVEELLDTSVTFDSTTPAATAHDDAEPVESVPSAPLDPAPTDNRPTEDLPGDITQGEQTPAGSADTESSDGPPTRHRDHSRRPRPAPDLGPEQPAGTGDPAATPDIPLPSDPATLPVDPPDTDADPVTDTPLRTTGPADYAENPGIDLDPDRTERMFTGVEELLDTSVTFDSTTPAATAEDGSAAATGPLDDALGDAPEPDAESRPGDGTELSDRLAEADAATRGAVPIGPGQEDATGAESGAPTAGLRVADVTGRPDDDAAGSTGTPPTEAVAEAPSEQDTSSEQATGGLAEATRAGAAVSAAAVLGDVAGEVAKRTSKAAANQNLGRPRTPRERRALRALLDDPLRALTDPDVRTTLVNRSDANKIATEVVYGVAGIPMQVGAGALLGPAGSPVAAGAAKALQTEVIGPRFDELFAEQAPNPVLAGPDGRMYRPGEDTPRLVNPLREPTSSGPIDDMLTTVDGDPLRRRSPPLVTPDGRPLTAPSRARRLLDSVRRDGGPRVLGTDGRPLTASTPDSPPAVLGADGKPSSAPPEGSVLRPRQPVILGTELREFVDAAPQREATALADLDIPDLDDLRTRTPGDVAPRDIVGDAVAVTRGEPVAREAAEAINSLPDGVDDIDFIRSGGTATPAPRRLRPGTLPAVAGEVTKNTLRLASTAAGLPVDAITTVGALANACSGALCAAAGKGVEQVLRGGTEAVNPAAIRTSAGADAVYRLAEAALQSPEKLPQLAAAVAAGSAGSRYLAEPGRPARTASRPTARSPAPGAPTTPRRIPTGVGGLVSSVVAPYVVENQLRERGVLPAEPLQENWRGQTANVVSRAAVGCLGGLTSRADCVTGAAMEASNAFFDETTAGQRAARFSETEYDGHPVRERVEAAAAVPILQARVVGSIGDVAGNAILTTGQTIGTGLAYAYDQVNGGARTPAAEYLQRLDDMGGAPATRAALSETVELLARMEQRRRQAFFGVPDRDPDVDSRLDAQSRERSGLPLCADPSEVDCIVPDTFDPSDPDDVGSARVGPGGGNGVRVTDTTTGRTSQYPRCTTGGQIDCIPGSSIDPTDRNSVGTVRRGDGRPSSRDGSGRQVVDHPDCEVLGQVQCVVGNRLRVGTGAPTRTNENGQRVQSVTYDDVVRSERSSTYTAPPTRGLVNPITQYRQRATDAAMNQARRTGNGIRNAATNTRTAVTRGVRAVRNAVSGAVDRVRRALPWNR